MSLIRNKPYVWVDKSGALPIIKFIYNIEENFGFTNESPIVSYNEDTVFLDYIIDDEAGMQNEYPMMQELTTQMMQMEKVTVRLHDQNGRLLGFHTVKPETGDFSVYGNVPPPIPYTYLKVIRTDALMVHIAGEIPVEYKFEGVDLSVDFNTFEAHIMLKFKITGTGEGGTFYHSQLLDSKTGYDPVLEDIKVELVVVDASGNVDRKGHGTTHGSEGDASGEG